MHPLIYLYYLPTALVASLQAQYNFIWSIYFSSSTHVVVCIIYIWLLIATGRER